MACQRTVRQCQLTCGKKLEKVEERMSEKRQTEELVSRRIWGSTPADVHSYVVLWMTSDAQLTAAVHHLWPISFLQTVQPAQSSPWAATSGIKGDRTIRLVAISLVWRDYLWIATSFNYLVHYLPPVEFLIIFQVFINQSCGINLHWLIITLYVVWNWPCWRRFWRRFSCWEWVGPLQLPPIHQQPPVVVCCTHRIPARTANQLIRGYVGFYFALDLGTR